MHMRSNQIGHKGRSSISLVAMVFILTLGGSAGCTSSAGEPGSSDGLLGINYFEAGVSATRNGNHDQAIRHFTHALNTGELSAEMAADSYLTRGIAYLVKGRIDIALVDFTESIRLNPQHYKAWNARGSIYHIKKKYDRAIENYSKSIRLKPDFHVAFNNRGAAYFEKGQYYWANEDYDEAIRLKPDYHTAFTNRGNVFNSTGRHGRAIEDYNESIRLKPDNYRTFNNRGLAFYRKGKFDQAVEDYTEAIRLKSDNPWAYHRRGLTYHQMGKCERSLADYSEALRQNPRFLKAIHDKAWALAASQEATCRDGGEALRLAKIALEIKDSSIPRKILAAAYAEMGDFDNAVKELKAAIAKINPEKEKKNWKEWNDQLRSYQQGKPWRDQFPFGLYAEPGSIVQHLMNTNVSLFYYGLYRIENYFEIHKKEIDHLNGIVSVGYDQALNRIIIYSRTSSILKIDQVNKKNCSKEINSIKSIGGIDSNKGERIGKGSIFSGYFSPTGSIMDEEYKSQIDNIILIKVYMSSITGKKIIDGPVWKSISCEGPLASNEISYEETTVR